MIYADITELASNPIRSGIQRVAREFLSRWSGTRELRACYFCPDRIDLVELPDEAFDLLAERDAATRTLPSAEIAERIRKIVAQSPVKPVSHTDVSIVVPELFFDSRRAEHYVWRQGLPGSHVSMLFFDFIPWLYPDKIGAERSAHLMPYLKLSLDVRLPAFISSQTYDDWRNRILREPDRPGVVLPLGADGLDLEKQTFEPGKRTIVCLGSIDGRKNQDVLARAFATAINKGLDLDLLLVGYAFDPNSPQAREITRITNACPRVCHIAGASDAEVQDILRSARATAYLSQLEGYGLPPVESLYAGIPVIVAEGIPSIERLPTDGQIRLTAVDEAAIEAALWRIADNSEAAHLWAGASTLELPTWAGFAAGVQMWLAHQMSPADDRSRSEAFPSGMPCE